MIETPFDSELVTTFCYTIDTVTLKLISLFRTFVPPDFLMDYAPSV
jgi:hypothetical protein